MASIPIVSDLIDTMKALPAALAEIPEKQRKHREEVLVAVTLLAEAVSQALNVVTARCGKLILESGDLRHLKRELVSAPMLLNDFRLSGVCAGLGKVRAELVGGSDEAYLDHHRCRRRRTQLHVVPVTLRSAGDEAGA